MSITTRTQRFGAYRDSYGWIKWDEPVTVTDSCGNRRYACRVCIGQFGLKETEVKDLPATRDDWYEHFVAHHMLPASRA